MTELGAINVIQFDLMPKESPYKVYDPSTGTDVDMITSGFLYTVDGVTEADGKTLRRMSIGELVMVVCLERATEMERRIIDLMEEMNENTNALNYLSYIEEQLVAGKKVKDIEGTYEYQGMTFDTTMDFLTYILDVLSDEEYATPLAMQNDILDRLQDGEGIYGMEGAYAKGESTYTKAYLYLYALGVNPQIKGVSGSSQMNTVFFLIDNKDIDSELGISCKAALQNIYGTTDVDELNKIMGPQVIDAIKDYQVTARAEYLESISTDEWITRIENKMDSLNSFSQEKMIQLQSETNKRDQSYDLITNILKSLNAELVGNSNNL